MSSNKSENLGLHLWEGEDDFLRTEFNENFQVLDQGIVTGSYSGNSTTQDIILGFRPRFLVISSPSSTSLGGMVWSDFFAGGNSGGLSDRIQFLDNGFRVTYVQASYPMLNSNQSRYYYYAFR